MESKYMEKILFQYVLRERGLFYNRAAPLYLNDGEPAYSRVVVNLKGERMIIGAPAAR